MENLTLVGTITAGISIIYNILTKLKNANLTKELLELEDLLTKEKAFVKSYQNTNKLLSSQINIFIIMPTIYYFTPFVYLFILLYEIIKQL